MEQSKLTALSHHLRERRETLLAEWLGTLRIGMERPGAILTDEQLRDHFGALLEDLCDQLEEPLTEASEISALKHAEVHGDTRWVQGYNLPELIREIAALRTVLVAVVVAYGHAHFSLHEQSLANIIVHRFFDALVLESVSFFAALSQDAAILRERQQLAQELHDSACQTIQGALFEIAVMCRQPEPPTPDQLANVTETLRQGVEDIRTISHGLVSVIRSFERGLPSALQALGGELSRKVPCEVTCDPGLDVPTKEGFQLFRIAQEAIGNALKHANAKSVSIGLASTNEGLELRVSDDGHGFDPSGDAASGIGLHNMKQRARSIGALLNVESRPAKGTTIICFLPKATNVGTAQGPKAV